MDESRTILEHRGYKLYERLGSAISEILIIDFQSAIRTCKTNN